MKNIDQSQDNTNHGFIQCLVLETVMAVLKSVWLPKRKKSGLAQTLGEVDKIQGIYTNLLLFRAPNIRQYICK